MITTAYVYPTLKAILETSSNKANFWQIFLGEEKLISENFESKF